MGAIVAQEPVQNAVGGPTVGFQTTPTVLTWVTQNNEGSRRNFAARFAEINIGPGAVIDSCTLTFDYAQSTGTNWLTMRMVDTDNHETTYVDIASMSSPAVTTASALVPGKGSAGILVSPDLKVMLQEVIDRPGWAYGNNIAFFGLANTGSTRSNQFYNITHETLGPGLVLDVAWTGGAEPAAGGGAASLRKGAVGGGSGLLLPRGYKEIV